ncbi:acylphosphatase [Methylopila sp. 73B]|uniref:acylphosphatase n=1 Tax=Methylopila sp. 73B TaxID=1120792 RepID=UPI00036013D5|nr:acylphosphatase [Methylopila sp. 73B]
MTDVAAEIVVTGRVQGVGYRAWARSNANGLGLRGLVRNRADGSVQAQIAGPEERIAAFAAACRAGPTEAKVERVERRAATLDAIPEGARVEIAPDA